jgi:hypothetical protein
MTQKELEDKIWSLRGYHIDSPQVKALIDTDHYIAGAMLVEIDEDKCLTGRWYDHDDCECMWDMNSEYGDATFTHYNYKHYKTKAIYS